MNHLRLLMIGALLIIGTSISAQSKLGHINSQEILQLLPERAEAENKLQTLNTQLEDRMKTLMAEYQNKVQTFQTLPEDTPTSTATDMRDEIVGMEQRIQEFQVRAEEDLAKKQQELLTPMIEKVQNAINEVGKENGFTYIFDIGTGTVVYTGGEDVSSMVKTKLGITG